MLENIEELPDELLVAILCFLPILSLEQVALVSTKLNRLANDDAVWKNIVQQELSYSSKPRVGDSYKFLYTKFLYIYKDYLQQKQFKKLTSESLDKFLSYAVSEQAEILVKNLINEGAIVTASHIREAIRSENAIIMAFLHSKISDEQLNSCPGLPGNNYWSKVSQQTIFHYAAAYLEYKHSLQQLVSMPSRITALPLLHKAALLGNISQIAEYVEQRININKLDVAGYSALWWALVNNQTECALILIENGAQLRNIGEGSALITCLKYKNVAALKAIIRKDTNLKEEFLLDNISIEEKAPKVNALHKAVEYDFVKGLAVLVKAGMQINHPYYSFGPLHLAAEKGHINCLQYLLNQNIDVNKKGNWYQGDSKDVTETSSSALFLAVKYQHWDCAHLLLQFNTNPNLGESSRYSVYDKWSEWFERSVVEECLYQLKSTSTYSFNNNSTLYQELSSEKWNLQDESFIQTQQHKHFLKVLLDKIESKNQARNLEFQDVIYELSLDQTLLDRNSCFRGSDTPLLNLLISMIMLKDYFFRFNKPYLKNRNTFIIHYIELLLNYEIDIAEKDLREGNTALHVAAKNEIMEVVQLLIEKGHANLNCKNKQGDTPLLLATQKGHAEIINYLLLKGATIDDKIKQDEALLVFINSCRIFTQNSDEKVIALTNVNTSSNTASLQFSPPTQNSQLFFQPVPNATVIENEKKGLAENDEIKNIAIIYY